MIMWDLESGNEIRSLNDYKKIFDDPKDYVVTGFVMPILSDPDSSIQISYKQDFVRDPLNHGCIFRLYSELHLFHLLNYEKILQDCDHLDIENIEPDLLNCTFDGNSLFHLYANRNRMADAIVNLLED